MRGVVFGPERNRYNKLCILGIINQAAALAFGNIFNCDDVGFVIAQGANGGPLERDIVVCQRKGCAIGG